MGVFHTQFGVCVCVCACVRACVRACVCKGVEIKKNEDDWSEEVHTISTT